MRKYRRSTVTSTVLTAVILIFALPNFVQALERKGNLSFYILIDRSLSMKEEIEGVKGYVIGDIIEDMMIPGDSITLFEFFRTPRMVLSTTISSQEDKRNISEEIERIQADKAYTDIGKALDFFEEQALSKGFYEHRSHTLLLSDLVQEAPKSSPYAGTQKEFSHLLLTPRKEIPRRGWRICIIGPDIEERAGRIAREVMSVRRTAD